MKFFDWCSGKDITESMDDFDGRIQRLPAEYRDAWNKIFNTLSSYSDFTGRNLIPVFDGIIELLESSYSEGESIEYVLGSDVETFCADIASNENLKTKRDKWRVQLNQNVMRKLEKLK